MVKSVGSRAQVFHGNAKKTSGGLSKGDLKKTKYGNIISKKASAASKKKYKNNAKIQKALTDGCRKLAKRKPYLKKNGKPAKLMKRVKCTQML